MNIQTFVEGVFASLIAGKRWQIERLKAPPGGRKPLLKDREMYKWYSNLSVTDQVMVDRLIRETIEGTVYSFLMVLDHKAFVEGYGPKGELELHYRAPNGERVHLNPLGGDNGKDLEYYFKTIREDVLAGESDESQSM